MLSSKESVDSIRSRLETKFVGQHLYYYSKLSSTMNIAKQKARQQAAEGTVVMAVEQTSGRGRLGRKWISPEGNLALSIILKPTIDILPQLIMIASLAVIRAIKKTTGVEAEIKWPNDVLIRGKKVCGILIENEIRQDRVCFAIVGIGINIALDPSTTPEISSVATSLSYESGRKVDKEKVTIALCNELEHLYLEAQAGAPVYQGWKQHMGTLGKCIHVMTGESVEKGLAETVTERGNLILRRANGTITEIMAGDVTIIKDHNP